MKKTRICFLIISFIFLILTLNLVSSQIFSYPPRSNILPKSIYSFPPVHCCTSGVLNGPESNCFLTVNADACKKGGGAVQECGTYTGPNENVIYRFVNLTQFLNSTRNYDYFNDPFFVNLTNSIAALNVSKNKYNISTYNCLNFSIDLERGLQNLGFNATLTFQLNRRVGHALVDVHRDNFVIFIEPQYDASMYIPYVSLDFANTGDKLISVIKKPNPYPRKLILTEKDQMLLTYDNIEEAYQAGLIHRP